MDVVEWLRPGPRVFEISNLKSNVGWRAGDVNNSSESMCVQEHSLLFRLHRREVEASYLLDVRIWL